MGLARPAACSLAPTADSATAADFIPTPHLASAAPKSFRFCYSKEFLLLGPAAWFCCRDQTQKKKKLTNISLYVWGNRNKIISDEYSTGEE